MRLCFFSKQIPSLILAVVIQGPIMNANLAARDHKTQTATQKASHEISITGEVIDPSCFLIHGAQGIKHKSCAQMCAKGGTTLTILDEKTNMLYIPVAIEHGKNPNDPLLPYAGDRVTAIGIGIVKNGYHGIVIKSVSFAGEKNAEEKK